MEDLNKHVEILLFNYWKYFHCHYAYGYETWQSGDS